MQLTPLGQNPLPHAGDLDLPAFLGSCGWALTHHPVYHDDGLRYNVGKWGVCSVESMDAGEECLVTLVALVVLHACALGSGRGGRGSLWRHVECAFLRQREWDC